MERVQRICLYIFCFSLNFEVWDPFETGGYFSISKFTGVLYFLASLPAILNYKTGIEFKPILHSIGLFFGYLILINAINADANHNSVIDFTMLQSIILFWILLNHAQSDPYVLEKGLLYFAFGSVVLALLYYNGIGIEIIDNRVSIFGDNENIIGQRMSFSILIIAMVVLQNRLQLNRARFLLLLLIPIMLELLIASGSRLAVISLLAVFVASVMLFKVNNALIKIVVLAVGLVGFIAIWQMLMNNDLIGVRLQRSFQEGDLSSRDEIWKSIMPLIEQNPVFGVGKTGYATYCNSVFGRYWSPHNVILEILCFSGIIGLSIYLFFLYQTFRMGYLTYKQNATLLPVLFMINIVGLLLVSHFLELKIGWTLLAYIASSHLINATSDNITDGISLGPYDTIEQTNDEDSYEWLDVGR